MCCAGSGGMPQPRSPRPAAVLAALDALGWGAEWLHRVLARQRAATLRDTALTGPSDTPGVPYGHPLHDPQNWARVRNDARLTRAKLVRYEQWLRLGAKRGWYAGGTVLVRAVAPTAGGPATGPVAAGGAGR